MAQLDTEIDGLYRLPLEEFTAARTALAKSLKGDAARDVRALKKPTTVPWAVNQVYWKARPTYDAAMKAGHALRQAQIATLKGKKADLRAATEAHRKAVGAAVREANQIASSAGLHPNTEQLARMFEAVSLAAAAPATTGKFTEVIEPSGFDALTGITPAKRVHVEPAAEPEQDEEQDEESAPPSKADRAAERRRIEQERREQREAEERLKTATRELERARTRAETARQALERAEADLAEAEREVETARATVTSASRRQAGGSR